MKEIKYRAWDKKEKWMVYDLFLSFDGKIYTDDVKYHDTPHKEVELVDKNRYIPLEYTGLKDKNGVEIYEGDIVCGESHLSSIKRQLSDVTEITGWDYYGVRFEKGSFRLYDLNTDDWVAVIEHSAVSESKSLAVIGNIYENTDIMEGADE